MKCKNGKCGVNNKYIIKNLPKGFILNSNTGVIRSVVKNRQEIDELKTKNPLFNRVISIEVKSKLYDFNVYEDNNKFILTTNKDTMMTKCRNHDERVILSTLVNKVNSRNLKSSDDIRKELKKELIKYLGLWIDKTKYRLINVNT